MKFRAGPAIVALIVVAVAGCAGEPDDSLATRDGRQSGPPSGHAGPPAAEPTASESAGSISGLVVDEEDVPVGGVQVDLLSSDLRNPFARATSDAEGRFTMNDLEAGEYALLSSRVGFEDSSRRVSVRAGEVTQVDLRLSAIAATQEPYHVALPARAHIKASYVFLTTFGSLGNATGALGNLCEPCIFRLFIEPAAVDVLVEAHWPPSGNDAVNTEIFLQYSTGYSTEGRGDFVYTGYVKNRQAVHFLGGDVESIASTTNLTLYVNGGFYSVSVDLKPEIWTTFAYAGALPEGYTALPPD